MANFVSIYSVFGKPHYITVCNSIEDAQKEALIMANELCLCNDKDKIITFDSYQNMEEWFLKNDNHYEKVEAIEVVIKQS